MSTIDIIDIIGLIAISLVVTVTLLALVQYYIHHKRKTARATRSRHLAQKQNAQKAEKDAQLVCYYACLLVDREIINSRNIGDEVIINLRGHFQIQGKNISNLSERKIFIRRLNREKDDPLPLIFFIISGNEVDSYLYPDGLLPRFIDDAELEIQHLPT